MENQMEKKMKNEMEAGIGSIVSAGDYYGTQ